MDCIQYMQDFAACTSFDQLPDLFHDSSRLPEAAVQVAHLLRMLASIISLQCIEPASSPLSSSLYQCWSIFRTHPV